MPPPPQGAVAVKLAQDDHKTEQASLRQDKRALKVELREMELSHEAIVKNLQLEYDKQNTKLRQDLQRTARELQQKYEKKMNMLREELELRRKIEIHEIEGWFPAVGLCCLGCSHGRVCARWWSGRCACVCLII